MAIRTAAVVGAGLAGLACARALARRWTAVLDRDAHVGTPGMSSLPRALAAGLDLRLSRSVVGLERRGEGWTLRHHHGDLARGPAPATPADESGPFDAVAVCVPHAQAAPLLPAPLAAALGPVRVAPCWALLAAFDGPVALPDTLRPEASPIVWAARDSAKPGRLAEAECWVAHAGPGWSRASLDRPPEAVAPDLLAALAALAGQLPETLHLAAHRWRYALVEQPLGRACLADAAQRIGAAGDWCLGPRAEHAWESGAALADALLGR